MSAEDGLKMMMGMPIDYNPHTNEKAMSLIEQPDGNWVAEGIRHGKAVRVRGSNPTNVLQGLLAADGKEASITV